MWGQHKSSILIPDESCIYIKIFFTVLEISACCHLGLVMLSATDAVTLNLCIFSILCVVDILKPVYYGSASTKDSQGPFEKAGQEPDLMKNSE